MVTAELSNCFSLSFLTARSLWSFLCCAIQDCHCFQCVEEYKDSNLDPIQIKRKLNTLLVTVNVIIL